MGTSGGAWMADPQVAFPTYFIPQGISADLIATRQGYSRDDVDAYAVESQRRAAVAQGAGRFDQTLEPVADVSGAVLLDYDEHVRPESTMQSLAALEPAFAKMGKAAGFDDVAVMRYPDVERINHVHHAGNSSGIVDGAAAVLLGTKQAGEKHGLKPRARIKGFSSIGSEPAIMLTGPSDSAEKVLNRTGMSVTDIDLFEVNEAFACVPMLFMDVLDVPHDKVNVNGGAIALGHPLGATGAMLLATLLDELERQDKQTGLATLCIGAGMGTATVIERV
jgi:acetyl-CoA C-acetyltransferase